MRRLKIIEEKFKIFFRELWESPLTFIFLTIVLLIGSMCLLWKLQTCLTSSPGTIFAIFIGFVTILGFYYTYKSIKQSYYISRIIIFPDLIRRITELVVEAIEKGEGAPLKIICFTPAVGNLSCYKEFEELKHTLERLAGEPRTFGIEIICLYDPHGDESEILQHFPREEQEEIKRILPQFCEFLNKVKSLLENRQDKEKYDKIINEMQDILRDQKEIFKKISPLFKFYLSYGEIFDENYGLKVEKKKGTRPYWDAYREAHELIELLIRKGVSFYMKREDNLPDFHLFLTNKRAIIYFPLSYYPYFFEQRRWESLPKEDILKEVSNQRTPVEILGFETTERDLITRFEEFFEFCRKFLK
jgi:hypothetical protein